MPGKRGDIGSRAINGLVGAGAAYCMRKVMAFAWKKVTGKEPPGNPEDPQVALGEAIAWALTVGAAVAVARIMAIRAAGRPGERRLAGPAD
ncbi:MAG TPA: DUF4235 domain-containing protein [Streptosporangiaceae bacterium]|nr:DUF4235 domain-containing protein [Streptosporangiaceae bacterium]